MMSTTINIYMYIYIFLLTRYDGKCPEKDLETYGISSHLSPPSLSGAKVISWSINWPHCM